MSLLLTLLVFSINEASNICQINVPIGLWLQNNRGPCNTVKGHFILDETADNFTEEIFSAFGRLKSIEGCLYVRGFNGSNSLSFFSNLKEVICMEEDAVASNLVNVIDVLGPSLDTMGFHSLKRVEGPGQIILSYEEVPVAYSRYDGLSIEGVQCFSKKEMLFLARHPQFNGKMYQPCEIDDPCFKLDHYAKPDIKWNTIPWSYRYTVEDIPDNCTTFVGGICICGPYEKNNPLFDKFANLTLLIGQIHIMGTLFDDVRSIFPQLESIYPYDLPGSTCNQEIVPRDLKYKAIPRKEALQIVRVRLNRFLANVSIPSLQPSRPIDISNPAWGCSGIGFDYSDFFPELIPQPCEHFAQFHSSNCGRFINNETYPGEISVIDEYAYAVWLSTLILSAIGVIFSFRTVVLLQFSNTTTCLPYSRQSIIFSIIVLMLAALERCILYQKFYKILGIVRNFPHILSEFDSFVLAYPIFQSIMLFIVSAKHICLILLPLCYVDVLIFYRIKKIKVSLLFYTVTVILTSFLWFYLHSQLFVTIRSRRPKYSENIHGSICMPFVMNVATSANFSKIISSATSIPFVDETLVFPYDLPANFDFGKNSLEIHGNTFPGYSNICDGVMLLVTIIFHILKYLGFIHPHNDFLILLFLYFQVSINRIRYYIYYILADDFCLRKGSYPAYEYYGHVFWEGISCYSTFQLSIHEEAEPIMDEIHWKILLKLLEKLPYLSYCPISIVCWSFARYESYLGPALHFREVRNEKKLKRDYDPADPSEIPPTSSAHS